MLIIGVLLGLAARPPRRRQPGQPRLRSASAGSACCWARSSIRFATDILLNADVAIVDALRLPLLATAFGMLLAGLWANREYPGLGLAFVGVLSNAAVIVINGGYMPIYEPSLIAAGFTEADVSSAIHVILPEGMNAAFLLRLGPLGDVDPDPPADHPERHLDRRRVPERRPGVLPVRQRGSNPRGARRGVRGGHPAAGRPDRGRRGRRRGRGDRVLHRLHRLGRAGASGDAGRNATGDGLSVARIDGRVRRGRRRPAAAGHGPRRPSGSASIPTSAWRSTGRSRRCGRGS